MKFSFVSLKLSRMTVSDSRLGGAADMTGHPSSNLFEGGVATKQHNEHKQQHHHTIQHNREITMATARTPSL